MRIDYLAQNTDVEKVKRLFQPDCMEPIPATAGRQSLPCTISHPQTAPAAAWPGFHAASAQSCFLCHLNPFASPKSAAAQWAVEPPWSPKQIPAARPAVKAALPKCIFPGALGEGAMVGSVQMLGGLMWAPQTKPSFPIDSSDVMKAHLILFFEAAMSSHQSFGMLLSPGCLKSWAHNVLQRNLLSAI